MKTLLLATAFAFAAGSAAAADAVVYDPAPEAVAVSGYDWSGAYIGVQLGYGSGDFTIEEEIFDPFELTIDVDGFVGGAYAGWNWQSGNIVYGVETDFNYSDVHESIDDSEIGFDWYGSTRARVGIAADRFLAFATVGVSYARAYVEEPGFEETETYVGWAAGAGLEYAFTDNVIGRVEYRYHDFGSQNWDGDVDLDANLHTGTFGISYKF